MPMESKKNLILSLIIFDETNFVRIFQKCNSNKHTLSINST
jgi:hypothetical protein